VRNSGGREHPLPRRVHDDVPCGEVRRTPLPRTSVDKGKKAQTGHGRMLPKALKEVPSIEPAGAGKTALVRRGRITTPRRVHGAL
jgi:hypothetical protein